MSSDTAPAVSAGQPALREAAVSFDRVGVSRFLLTEVPIQPVEEGRKRADYKQVRVQFGAGINMLADGRADFRLQLRVVTDPRSKPYEIELELVGTFSMTNGTREDLLAFCQTSAAPILFPYARQIVNEVTSNGRFGPVRLPLMNLQGVLGTGVWEPEKTGAEKDSQKPQRKRETKR